MEKLLFMSYSIIPYVFAEWKNDRAAELTEPYPAAMAAVSRGMGASGSFFTMSVCQSFWRFLTTRRRFKEGYSIDMGDPFYFNKNNKIRK
jgi:hypothetical protein